MFQAEEKTLSEQQLILHLIHQNDYDTLKELGINKANINFLEQFNEIEVDQKISPLICACYLGRLEIVKLLLSNQQVDVDLASMDSGQTPLSIAAMTGNYEILKILLDAGAEVNKPNIFNQTAFIMCFARLEEEKNVFENRKICFKMAELLLHYGADINWIVDKTHGFNLLMQLCSIRMELNQKEAEINYQIIKFLIENGAQKDLQSLKGKKASDLLKKHSNKERLMELMNNTQQLFFYGKQKNSSRYSNQQQQLLIKNVPRQQKV
ncbi:unnamed protein product [Paramecium sonneborni]|uniref:Ankyrin repeat-containing domain n=1 Tax=Paramecium sonneborni TaxID=65129 RepID=A0A8S1N229_9CILI|nr:unnamed protein product [Paramecium sonneborni]